jgi:hypothetical protein
MPVNERRAAFRMLCGRHVAVNCDDLTFHRDDRHTETGWP